ncbi:MAG: amylo-alpha-1,6-glucosidase [Rhodomicrobium sp.]
MKCLEWIDRYGDLDGDGFQEYKTFSSQGYHNMGWKDSGVAVLYPDGSQVQQPIAICELQGLVYDAKCRMSEVFETLDKDAKAKALKAEAEALKTKFNEKFWMEEQGTYAYALGPDKKQVKTIASNPGQLLLTGIVDGPAKARSVIHRLLQPDMYSGWGIRSLSKNNPAYDPNAYQLGAIWPHDNAWIAAGAKRYGLWQEANQIAKGIFDAADMFQMYRLPVLFAGADRERDEFPVQYLGANTPQAWAAGSVFMFMRALLGIEPDAPRNRLELNPTLPDRLPEVTLQNLRVGDHRLTIRFSGRGTSSRFEVLEGADGITINGKAGVA